MKTKILASIFIFFIFGACSSPEAPEEPRPNYEYRYNVEVIYTPATVDYPERQDWVRLAYYLKDPALMVPPNPRDDYGIIDMEKIEENKYRCYLQKVFVQTLRNPDKHYVVILIDNRRSPMIPTAENIDIQGAYEKEVKIYDFGTFINSRLYFKMSKE